MAIVKVKQVIPHPDGAVIVVPEDTSQRSFCIPKERLEKMGGVKAGEEIVRDYHRR